MCELFLENGTDSRCFFVKVNSYIFLLMIWIIFTFWVLSFDEIIFLGLSTNKIFINGMEEGPEGICNYKNH